MPRAEHDRREPSQRQLRVGELMRQALAELLARGDLREPVLQEMSITVSEVRVSPDLRHATVYVLPLGGGQVSEVIAALTRSRGHLRGQLGRMMTLKFTPELRFVPDTSFEVARQVEDVLRSPRVARDLADGQADEE